MKLRLKEVHFIILSIHLKFEIYLFEILEIFMICPREIYFKSVQ